MTRRGGVADRFDRVFSQVQEKEAQQLAAMRGDPSGEPAGASGDDAPPDPTADLADVADGAAGERSGPDDDHDAPPDPTADLADVADSAAGEGSGPDGDPRDGDGVPALDVADSSGRAAPGGRPVADPGSPAAVGEEAGGGALASSRDGSGHAAEPERSRPRPPAPIAKVSDDPDDWREIDHALARNADDPSQWDRSTFRTSAWLADGLATMLKRRKRRLRLGGGEGMQFAATDRHMRKVLSLQLLTNLPLGDLDELESLLRRGFAEGWFDDDDASAYLEVTTEMRDALDAVVARLRQRGLKRVGLRHVQILALVYGIDPDEPVVARSEAVARLDQLLR